MGLWWSPLALLWAVAVVGARAEAGFDVLVVLGQSNAAGWGDGPPLSVNPRIWALSFAPWGLVPARDPLPTPTGHNRVGLGLTAAAAYWNDRDTPRDDERIVVLVNCARPGTGFADGMWLPGQGEGPSWCRAQLERLVQTYEGVHRVVGLLWHQGETDALAWERERERAERQPLVYAGRLQRLVHELRHTFPGAAGDTPFVVAPFVPIFVRDGGLGVRAFDRVLRNVDVFVSHAAVAEVDDLGHEDGIHFSAAALRTLGRRYGAALAVARRRAQPRDAFAGLSMGSMLVRAAPAAGNFSLLLWHAHTPRDGDGAAPEVWACVEGGTGPCLGTAAGGDGGVLWSYLQTRNEGGGGATVLPRTSVEAPRCFVALVGTQSEPGRGARALFVDGLVWNDGGRTDQPPRDAETPWTGAADGRALVLGSADVRTAQSDRVFWLAVADRALSPTEAMGVFLASGVQWTVAEAPPSGSSVPQTLIVALTSTLGAMVFLGVIASPALLRWHQQRRLHGGGNLRLRGGAAPAPLTEMAAIAAHAEAVLSAPATPVDAGEVVTE
jgi:hypothetical protein